MFHKLPILLVVTGFASAGHPNGSPEVVTASRASPVTVSSTPPPLSIVPSPTPQVVSYSVTPVAVNSARIESYGSVTVHPPPTSRLSLAPVAPYPETQYAALPVPVQVKNVPTQTVLAHAEPQYVPSPVTYAVNPVYVKSVQQYASYPTPVAAKYSAPVVTKTVTPVVKYVKAARIVESPAISYSATPIIRKYVTAPLLSKSYVQSYAPEPVYVKPIPVPVEYPVVQKSVPFVYSSGPVEYAQQAYDAVPYSKALIYSPATAVSHVSFNGLGASYVY